jgi:hypothetical protein
VTPLVQTVGHLEWVLKHAAFAHLRHTPTSLMDLCPTAHSQYALSTGAGAPTYPSTTSPPLPLPLLIHAMLDQVLSLHEEALDSPIASPGSDGGAAAGRQRFVHIGCDEVFSLYAGGCDRCRERAGPTDGRSTSVSTAVTATPAAVSRAEDGGRSGGGGVSYAGGSSSALSGRRLSVPPTPAAAPPFQRGATTAHTVSDSVGGELAAAHATAQMPPLSLPVPTASRMVTDGGVAGVDSPFGPPSLTASSKSSRGSSARHNPSGSVVPQLSRVGSFASHSDRSPSGTARADGGFTSSMSPRVAGGPLSRTPSWCTQMSRQHSTSSLSPDVARHMTILSGETADFPAVPPMSSVPSVLRMLSVAEACAEGSTSDDDPTPAADGDPGRPPAAASFLFASVGGTATETAAPPVVTLVASATSAVGSPPPTGDSYKMAQSAGSSGWGAGADAHAAMVNHIAACSQLFVDHVADVIAVSRGGMLPYSSMSPTPLHPFHSHSSCVRGATRRCCGTTC